MTALFNFSPRAIALQSQLADFMQNHVLPAETAVAAWQAHAETRWLPCPSIEAV
jgi:hypothetical protein